MPLNEIFSEEDVSGLQATKLSPLDGSAFDVNFKAAKDPNTGLVVGTEHPPVDYAAVMKRRQANENKGKDPPGYSRMVDSSVGKMLKEYSDKIDYEKTKIEMELEAEEKAKADKAIHM